MNLFQKVKLLFSFGRIIKEIKEVQMKAGIGTSEFWLTVLGQAVPLVMALWGLIPQNVMLAIMGYTAIISAVYVIARTWVKVSKSKNDDAIFNKVNAILKPIADKLGIKLEDLPTE